MPTSFVAPVHSQSVFSSHGWQPFFPRLFPESLHCSNFIWYLFCQDTLSARLQFHTNPLSPDPYNLLLPACHIQAFFFTWQTAILSPNSDQNWPSWGLPSTMVILSPASFCIPVPTAAQCLFLPCISPCKLWGQGQDHLHIQCLD